jgi:hypothetical protein
MQITINSVDIDRQAKYSKAIVSYTNDSGKSEKRNVMSFTNKELYAVLSNAKPGEVYDTTENINDKGYKEFTNATKSTSAAGPKSTAATATPKSTYETPEERAARQLYIIRQSNINAAISFLSVGAKTLKIEDVLETAKTLEDYVFGRKPIDLFIMDEDIPEIN